MLQLWEREIPNVFALVARIEHARKRGQVADVVAQLGRLYLGGNVY